MPILNREMENRKKNQLKIIELKNVIADWTQYQNGDDKGQVSKLEDGTIKIIQPTKETEKD